MILGAQIVHSHECKTKHILDKFDLLHSMATSKDILFWTPRGQLLWNKRIIPVKNIAELAVYVHVLLPQNDDVTKPRAWNTFLDGLAELGVDKNACTLVSTFFRWHGKMEFKCHLHFSFSHAIEKQIWILLFVFHFRPNFEKRFSTSYFVFRFRITLKKGYQFQFSFFVFASLWKTDMNFVFPFSFSHYFEKRIWISFLVFSSLWKTDLNFVCHFCMTWKRDRCTSPVIWRPGHPLAVDRGIYFLCNWK